MISKLKLLFLIAIINLACVAESQRVAPGVPPQQYQNQQMHHPPPPQQPQFQQPHHHQQPPQQQQPQYQQQPPQQQQPHYQQPQQTQYQQQQQQQQQQHQPRHHGHMQNPQVLDASNVKQERGHIQEHMEVPLDTSQMTEQELQFHYFKMHDADNNNKLDGSELVKSLIHWHDQSNHDPNSGAPVPEAKIFTDQELMQMIDPILLNDDKNKDGFIDYGEFVTAQAAAAAKTKTA